MGMDFTPYLREIDQELAQLHTVRRMLMELREPVLINEPVVPRSSAAPVVAEPVVAEPLVVEPSLTIVPPKQKREYHRRGRVAAEPKAIGAPIPERPVFVKPVVVAAPAKVEVPAPVELDVVALEAAMRRKLLGEVA